MISEAKCMDNMEFMAQFPDKFFDLAIVDPPYGIGENWKKDKNSKFYKHKSTYKNNVIPSADYFRELIRVSTHQIIWGGNYYTAFLEARNSWIVWDKKRPYPKHNMSEGELAWTSFNIPLRICSMLWNGCCNSEKRSGIHPHEKPVGLYRWILNEYGKGSSRILDTHMGSQSLRIAANIEGFDFYGCELDKDYFEAGCKRFEQHIKQQVLF